MIAPLSHLLCLDSPMGDISYHGALTTGLLTTVLARSLLVLGSCVRAPSVAPGYVMPSATCSSAGRYGPPASDRGDWSSCVFSFLLE